MHQVVDAVAPSLAPTIEVEDLLKDGHQIVFAIESQDISMMKEARGIIRDIAVPLPVRITDASRILS